MAAVLESVQREKHEMPIYEITNSAISSLDKTTFSSADIKEGQLQACLRERVDVIGPDTLVIAEEFGDWDKSHRRIDLLAIDKEAKLVVIELKRTEHGGHMELQALRYAAMVSRMTFDQAVKAFQKHLKDLGKLNQDPRKTILDFLDWAEPDEEEFAQDVRIILASAEFSTELTSSILWLRTVRLIFAAFD
jgi:Endonuclease NucS